MAHKVLVGGTAYEVTGGRTLIGGTAHDIASGKVLVGGTAYDVSFGPEPLIIAQTGLGVVNGSFSGTLYASANGTVIQQQPRSFDIESGLWMQAIDSSAVIHTDAVISGVDVSQYSKLRCEGHITQGSQGRMSFAARNSSNENLATSARNYTFSSGDTFSALFDFSGVSDISRFYFSLTTTSSTNTYLYITKVWLE